MTADTTNEADSVYRIGVRRALTAGDASALQLHFDVAVLQRYRDAGGFSIIRTNTVGRVKKEGAWVLDFGISPDETSIHVAFSEVARLPEDERVHWVSCGQAGPSSKMFLQMRLAPGACYDDGEVRSWQ
jgi:hypothetical protein